MIEERLKSSRSRMWRAALRIMRGVLIGAISAQPGLLHAADFSFLAGTYSVQFVPMQVAGVQTGCTLVFKAIAVDYVYAHGEPLFLTGNIAYVASREKKNIVLGLKLGLRDALNPQHVLGLPPIAYLQTGSVNTAHDQVGMRMHGEPGYALYVYRLNDSTVKLLGEMISTSKVTIGFNRKKGGMDILAPIDLTVVDTYQAGSETKRKHSPEATQEFTACVTEVTKAVVKAATSGN